MLNFAFPSPTFYHTQLWDGREDVIFACLIFKGLITPRVGENRACVTLRVGLLVTCRWQMEGSQLSVPLVLSRGPLPEHLGQGPDIPSHTSLVIYGILTFPHFSFDEETGS